MEYDLGATRFSRTGEILPDSVLDELAGTAAEVATQGSVNTRSGVERCVRYAFELART